MALVLVSGKLAREQFDLARQDYGSYIKITMDVAKKDVVLGGEYHADAEKLLLEKGSKQKEIFIDC